MKLFRTLVFGSIFFATTTAFAAVRRNAGPSLHGGMALDVNWYCKQIYGQASVSINIDNTAGGWRCTQANQLVGLSMADACRMHYGNTATVNANGTDGGAWHCILGLNLTWFCQQQHGAGARAVRLFDNAYGWRCQVGQSYLALSMTDACRSHYGSNFLPVLGWSRDSQSWHCQSR